MNGWIVILIDRHVDWYIEKKIKKQNKEIYRERTSLYILLRIYTAKNRYM